jgi:hypothetical protein
MLKTVAKLLLLRVLPRRLIPIVTIVEAILLIRSVRRRSVPKVEVQSTPRVAVTEQQASRTAPPQAADVRPDIRA